MYRIPIVDLVVLFYWWQPLTSLLKGPGGSVGSFKYLCDGSEFCYGDDSTFYFLLSLPRMLERISSSDKEIARNLLKVHTMIDSNLRLLIVWIIIASDKQLHYFTS